MATSEISAAELAELVRENRTFGALSDAARKFVSEALEPVSIPGGAVLIREGDPADCLYLVAAGRLRVTTTDAEGNDHPLAEIGRGDLVGEMAIITDRPRSATVYALRDTHLLRLSTDAFTKLSAKHPESVRALGTTVVDKLMQSRISGRASTPVVTVALLPLGPEPAIGEFIDRLERSFARLTGAARRVDSAAAVEAVGPDLESRQLAAWCSDLEAEHELVLYAADPTPSPWTQACIRQADLILLVADATTRPEPRLIERIVPQSREVAQSRSELVLLHPSWTQDPRGTSHWLSPRNVDRHHHVRVDREADVERVGRLLLSRGIGVVYSGGGARGISEVGVLRAMREAGIPIDVVGGTSIGSIMAGATARMMSADEVAALLRTSLVEGKSPVDVTFPAVSLATGARVTRQMQDAAAGLDMEDGWLNGFCISTNLTRGEVEVHRRGPGWFALRASFSIPGVFPPMRTASGDVLVDGGVLDNMPVSTMRSHHDGVRVVAVDVGSQRDVRAGALPESGVVSGWRWLVERVDPRAPTIEMAGLMKVLMRITELGGGGNPADRGDLYIRPEVDGVGMLDFKAFDRLVQSGYEAGSRAFEDWLSGPDAPSF